MHLLTYEFTIVSIFTKLHAIYNVTRQMVCTQNHLGSHPCKVFGKSRHFQKKNLADDWVAFFFDDLT